LYPSLPDHHRDRLTEDDTISSAWLHISTISALGEDGLFPINTSIISSCFGDSPSLFLSLGEGLPLKT